MDQNSIKHPWSKNRVKFSPEPEDEILSARYKINTKIDWQEQDKKIRKRRWIREGKIKPIVDVDNKDDNWTSSSDDEFQAKPNKQPLPSLKFHTSNENSKIKIEEASGVQKTCVFQKIEGSNYSQNPLFNQSLKASTINKTFKRLQRKQLVTQILKTDVSGNLFKYPEIPSNEDLNRFDITKQPRMKILRKINTCLNDFSEKNMRHSMGFNKKLKTQDSPKVINPYYTGRSRMPIETIYKLVSPLRTERDFYDPTVLQETLGYYIKPEYEDESVKHSGLTEWINSIKMPEYLHPEASIPKGNYDINKNANAQLDNNKFNMYFKRVIKKYPIKRRSRFVTLSPR